VQYAARGPGWHPLHLAGRRARYSCQAGCVAQGRYPVAARQAPKKRRGPTDQLPAEEQIALKEAEEIATVLGVPVVDTVQVLADDRESYIPPPITTTTDNDHGDREGQLLNKFTVNAYIAAVMELWRVQVAHSGKNTCHDPKRDHLQPEASAQWGSQGRPISKENRRTN
jgi:hypothetical protein